MNMSGRKMPKIRRIVHQCLAMEEEPEKIALAIGDKLVALGAIPRAQNRSWTKVVLMAFVTSALNRFQGDTAFAARTICEDLAYRTSFQMVRGGWFSDDPHIMKTGAMRHAA